MSDCSLCLQNLRKTTQAYWQADATKVTLVHCQVLVQLEGKVKARLSSEVLTWGDAFASTLDKVDAAMPQQEMLVLAPTRDLEMTLMEKTGGRQEAWKE